MGSSDLKREALEILRPRLSMLERMSWTEMDAYGERVEEIVESPSGL